MKLVDYVFFVSMNFIVYLSLSSNINYKKLLKFNCSWAPNITNTILPHFTLIFKFVPKSELLF